MPKNKMPRMFDWLLASLALIALIAWIAPQQLPVSAYKLSLITIAAVVGYWIDRSLFPYARPDVFLASTLLFGSVPEDVRAALEAERTPRKGCEFIAAAAMLRRAIIVGCAMLAVSLGV